MKAGFDSKYFLYFFASPKKYQKRRPENDVHRVFGKERQLSYVLLWWTAAVPWWVLKRQSAFLNTRTRQRLTILNDIFRLYLTDTLFTLSSYFTDTSDIPQLYSSYTFPIYLRYSPLTVLILYPYSPHTVPILFPYCFHTEMIRKPYGSHTEIICVLTSYMYKIYNIISDFLPKSRVWWK